MVNRADEMGVKSINYLLYRFCLPSTVGMVVIATYNVMDTFFIGRLGSEAIAALSIVFPLQMLLGAFGLGIGVGASSLISRSLGAGDKEEAESALGQVISLSLIFSSLIALGSYFFLRPLLVFFGAWSEIMVYTEEYASVILYGAVVFFLLMGLNNVIRAEGNPIFSMKIMISTALINIALDPLFIFVFDMGVRGAAVATVLSKCIGVAVIFYHFFTARGDLKLRAQNIKLKLSTIVSMYRVGISGMIRPFSLNLSLLVANNILAAYGHIPVATMGLFFRLQMLAILPVVGFSEGLLPIVGYNFAAGKMHRTREILIKGIVISTIFIGIFAAGYITMPEFFFSIFSSDQELISLGGYALPIMAMMFPLIGMQAISGIYFQAVGKGMPALILSLLREVMLFIPVLLILSNLMGLGGVWVSRPISDLLAFVITFIMIYRELKRQKLLSPSLQTLQKTSPQKSSN